jgi:hypothetical protein
MRLTVRGCKGAVFLVACFDATRLVVEAEAWMLAARRDERAAGGATGRDERRTELIARGFRAFSAAGTDGEEDDRQQGARNFQINRQTAEAARRRVFWGCACESPV